MTTKNEKRIGVFICHCGKNIAGGLDIKSLVEGSKHIQGVVSVIDHKFSCSEDGQNAVQTAIQDQKLNRVVIAACDPSLHLMTFQRCGEKAGIEPEFVDLIDIRKWTMQGSPQKIDPQRALEQSEKLIELAAKRIRLKRIIPSVEVEPEQSVLVIGGGVAGLTAGLDLAV
jgi:heterodisulfide reductase subunit A